MYICDSCKAGVSCIDTAICTAFADTLVTPGLALIKFCAVEASSSSTYGGLQGLFTEPPCAANQAIGIKTVPAWAAGSLCQVCVNHNAEESQAL